MSNNLVIVESPAKAKTIEGYLGKEFTVKSSYGHVMDLPKGNDAIDIKNKFKPHYIVMPDKKDVVSELKKVSSKADIVWLATDDDREGEAISWHLKNALELDDSKIKRIVFREITKKAIQKAIDSPRGIDIDLVNAQQARRVLDRLVGFELSPILWKKIKRGLSAGRVQSVAVRFIVEREREIEKFSSSYQFKITGFLTNSKSKKIKSELDKKFKTEEEAMKFLEECKNALYKVAKLEKKPLKRSPSAPFTTSTLQQEASRKLSFSVSQTMSVAQKLYEAGKISYMRTDSVNLSEDALEAAKIEITKKYGAEYHQTRRYKTKSESAQEAHEAIRPTDFGLEKASDDRNEQRLYQLIRMRAEASQMADAEIEKTIVDISISTSKNLLIATGEVTTFEGFLKSYQDSKDDDLEEEDQSTLPPLKEGEMLDLQKLMGQQRYSSPPARYNEATLVKKLEEMGIGRPSTYAPTISTIQKRTYVIKENREGKVRKFVELTLDSTNKITKIEKTENYGSEKMKLFPTDIGIIVNDFLVENFANIVDYSFTATVEKDFDQIANGNLVWDNMLDSFYSQFHSKVENTETNVSRASVSTAREIGVHPVTGENMYVKLGKFGPYVQLGEVVEDVKPKYASLKKGQLMETLTIEEALELFKLPRNLGEFEDQDMIVAIGQFGPYIKHSGKFYSLPKGDEPLDILPERGVEIILAKRDAEEKKLIQVFSETIKVLNGRYGPYISYEGKNVKIPKGVEPTELTLEQCKELADKTPDAPKGGKRFFKKK